ncbi:winged helix-turn-helix transcriptional regulator [Halopiger aswanensis]|uniref:HxlR family transcriptional regulator n=1 Tax=Halopiger aswanensis TaxID=148449 RepID=A0A419VY44_9EURY|nr:helix-turn-helix domain-containing protein [Halopiger aswanensis]RKD88142.1 HxlR family transcriptional regulator [Halopiger aswanensis]
MTDSDWQAIWHSLHSLLGAKWTSHVLRLLTDGDHGFNDMKAELDGITATMLSRRLSELECHGLVDRSVEATTPPTTQYRLTDRGVAVAERLRALEDVVQVATCEKGENDCNDTTDCQITDDELCVTGISASE